MSDITQAATAAEVVFTANTVKAEKWMKDHTVTYKLPGQRSDAVDFKKRAQAAGLTVRSL